MHVKSPIIKPALDTKNRLIVIEFHYEMILKSTEGFDGDTRMYIVTLWC